MADQQTNIPEGYCQCGCGQKTKLAPYNDKRVGWIKGKPIKFINFHQNRGENNPKFNNWSTQSGRYKMLYMPDYPKANSKGYVAEHILKAEQALGKSLPKGVHVHHHSETQLVICENQAYHFLLHVRTKAYQATGNPNWRKCRHCQQWDAPENLRNSGRRWWHRECANQYMRLRSNPVR